jgi:hypothetical protein
MWSKRKQTISSPRVGSFPVPRQQATWSATATYRYRSIQQNLQDGSVWLTIGKLQLKPVGRFRFSPPSHVKLYSQNADYAFGSNSPCQLSLGGPPDRRVLKLSPDHFLTQFFRTLANTDAGRKMMLVCPIRFRLLPDVFVISRDTLVRQFF